jgi:hypothetical protein
VSGVARLGAGQPLRFASADAARDLPAFVRAASGIRRWRGRLVVLQDDVNALAMMDEAGAIVPLVLPAGAGGRRSFSDARGNKAAKMDLEACTALPDGRLLVLGSGSSPVRERLVLIDSAHRTRIVDGSALFARLRDRQEFAGSELNIEGVVAVAGRLRLFQRGNGAVVDGRAAVNAVGDIDLAVFLLWLDHGAPPPPLLRVLPVHLGEAGGVPYGFTDATALPDGRIAFLAVAEASPDVRSDGAVCGVRFGMLDDARVTLNTAVLDEQGIAIRLKLEGIDYLGVTASGALEFAVVADMDNAEEPAMLARLTWEPSPAGGA